MSEFQIQYQMSKFQRDTVKCQKAKYQMSRYIDNSLNVYQTKIHGYISYVYV